MDETNHLPEALRRHPGRGKRLHLQGLRGDIDLI